MIHKAVEFAANAHKGMVRKGANNIPYIFHPLEVLHLASLMTTDEDILCAAVLHDVVEDTGVSVSEIEEKFNERVARLVSYETEDKRGNVNKSETWMDRKKEAIDTINNIDDLGAKMVCLADKVSNIRSFHLGLLQEGDDFWNRFNQKDPLKHYWYYNELRKALVDLDEYAVYKEYCFMLDAVFSKYLKEKKDE